MISEMWSVLDTVYISACMQCAVVHKCKFIYLSCQNILEWQEHKNHFLKVGMTNHEGCEQGDAYAALLHDPN
jgi:hypothetical protein